MGHLLSLKATTVLKGILREVSPLSNLTSSPDAEVFLLASSERSSHITVCAPAGYDDIGEEKS